MFDLHMGLGVAFGFLAGWAARTARAVNGNASWASIKKDLLVSSLIAGGAVIIVLYAVRLLHLDPLGGAAISFALAWGGITAIGSIGDGIVDWLRGRLGDKGKDE